MNRTTITRAVATALLGTALAASTVPVLSQPMSDGGRGHGPRAGQLSETDRAQMRERMQARMNERLDQMAARLAINASQQDAWSAYRKARESIFGTIPQRPAPDADAATLTRFRAEIAQRRAQHLLTMADVTAKLQEVLDSDQRKALDEITRRGGRYGGRHYGAGGRA
jgi:hypothetical protein